MTLSNEQRINYSVQLQDKSDKYLSRFLLFSVVLIFLHLLEIEPSEIDVVGVKFNVKDSSVIYAAVSLIVIHNFYQTVSHSFTGSAMWKFSGERQIIKSFL